LGLLVALTQYHPGSVLPILFFAVVIAIWLGLNNTARDLVRERRLYVRDRLAGLQPLPYLGAKIGLDLAVGAAQIALLMGTIRVACGAVLDTPVVLDDLANLPAFRFFLALGLSYFGGVLLGRLASTLARTEEQAVAALPLLIMPQVLISVVAVGLAAEPYTKDRPFRPLAVTLNAGSDGGTSENVPESSASWAPSVVDVLSLAILSRPATIVAEGKAVAGHSSTIWVADLIHLAILVSCIGVLLVVEFTRRDRGWIARMGV
jgi:hypothetical protein